jgi:hypothetical protein
MAKRTNRRAWGLVVLLAVVVLVGVGALLSRGIQVGPYAARLSWSRVWRVDPGVAWVAYAPDGTRLTQTIRWFKLGYLRIQVTMPPPRGLPSLWKASPRSGPGQ